MSHAIGVLEIYSDAIRSCDDMGQSFLDLDPTTLFKVLIEILGRCCEMTEEKNTVITPKPYYHAPEGQAFQSNG